MKLNFNFLRYPKYIFSSSKKILLVIGMYTLIAILFFSFFKGDKISMTTTTSRLTEGANSDPLIQYIASNEALSISKRQYLINDYKKIMCSLTGDFCSNKPEEHFYYLSKSVSGQIAKIFVYPYLNPPASFTYWASNGLHNAGFIHKTYAMGIGTASIQSLIPVWKAMRDISYLLIVLILVTIGFMIMFRTKINPQTIVSVENSLPRVILTLIYITFSFAIAGLLIDIMYISIALIVTVFSHINGWNTQKEIASYMNSGFGSIAGKLMGGKGIIHDVGNIFYTLPTKIIFIFGAEIGWILRVIFTIISFVIVLMIFRKFPGFGSINTAFNNLFENVDAGINFGGVVKIASGLPKALWKAVTGSILTAVLVPIASLILAPFIIGLIIFFTILYVLFRIIFLLISAYIKIILYVIFAPILILLNTLPGKDAFKSWLQNLTAELITFPAVITILVTGSTIININVTRKTFFTPPFFSGLSIDVITYLIGMAFLFMTPDLVQVVKKLLVPKPLPMPELGLGTFFGSVGAMGGGAMTGLQYASTASYVGFLGGFLKKIGLNFPGNANVNSSPSGSEGK